MGGHHRRRSSAWWSRRAPAQGFESITAVDGGRVRGHPRSATWLESGTAPKVSTEGWLGTAAASLERLQRWWPAIVVVGDWFTVRRSYTERDPLERAEIGGDGTDVGGGDEGKEETERGRDLARGGRPRVRRKQRGGGTAEEPQPGHRLEPKRLRGSDAYRGRAGRRRWLRRGHGVGEDRWREGHGEGGSGLVGGEQGGLGAVGRWIGGPAAEEAHGWRARRLRR